jgi:hypothetical protein
MNCKSYKTQEQLKLQKICFFIFEEFLRDALEKDSHLDKVDSVEAEFVLSQVHLDLIQPVF